MVRKEDQLMGCRIMHDREQNIATLYCSTTDVAFGPLFCDIDLFVRPDDANYYVVQDAGERAEAFLRWLPCDPRTLADADLMRSYCLWLTDETAQYKRENPEHCQDCGEPVGTCDDDCPSKVKVSVQAEGGWSWYRPKLKKF
jgi:hypothetical protein